MGQRTGSSGTVDPSRDVVVAVGVIAAGAGADVALPADATWITESALRVAPIGAPLANLIIQQAWISNPATGVVTIRFGANTGGVVAGNQAVRISSIPGSVG